MDNNETAPNSHFSDEHLRDLVDYALREDEPEIDGEKVSFKKRKIWISIKTTFKKVKKTAKREKAETIIAVQILRRFVHDKESVTEEELVFLKEQSIDLARILPIVLVQAVPAPVPITPFLVALGSKIGINLIPKEQVTPEEYRQRVPKDGKGRPS